MLTYKYIPRNTHFPNLSPFWGQELGKSRIICKSISSICNLKVLPFQVEWRLDHKKTAMRCGAGSLLTNLPCLSTLSVVSLD